MGCASSIPKRNPASWKKKKKTKSSSINEVVVFVPVLQIPVPIDFVHPLRGFISRELIDRLSSLRSRVVSLAEKNVVDDVSELQHVLDEYLPVLLGLIIKEHNLESLVEFKWRMLGDDGEETCLASAWYEVLSVIHLMAMLSLLQANLMLVPKESSDEGERKISEDSKKFAVDLFIKASGCLDYCVRQIMVQLPLQIRKNLPNSLQEGMLEAISVQALAQGVEMQLGLALECEKATLSVKRRLACEAVSYFAQDHAEHGIAQHSVQSLLEMTRICCGLKDIISKTANLCCKFEDVVEYLSEREHIAHYCLTGCYTSDGSGKKLLLFLQWKYLEAKAAAYYYHGLVLDKGTAPTDHVGAVYCLFASEELLRDGKRACLSFCLASPVTRVPPVWGVMKHLNKKIPETASKKAQMYGYLLEQDKACQSLPDLPEFQLSLKPDDYNLPEIDATWDNENCEPQIQSLKEHLKDEEEEEEEGATG